MKKLLQYLGNYKKESILGPLFKLLEASFELIVPLVMAAIIDTGVANADRPYIMKMSLVLFLLALIGLTCAITAQYFAAKAAVGCATGLRHALFEHIETLSFTEMDTVGTSTLITRMTSDVNQVQNGVNLVLRLFLRSPFIVFGAMVMAFTIDVKAALVFVVTIPLLSVVVFGIMLVSIPLYKKVQAALDKVLGITRDNYGMVLQETWLRSGSIRDNIAMGKPDATDEEIIAAAKASHAHGFIKRLPEGYDTVIAEDGGNLSQGQKQLLCIARVMLCLPPMLILDEATSSIDTRTEIKIQNAFAKMMQGRTSFIVAHRLSTIREADIILVMKDGSIIEQGNHEELLEKNGFYAKLYNSQFAPRSQRAPLRRTCWRSAPTGLSPDP